MPIPITPKTVIATYHHARQSDLDPTRAETQAWAQILQSNYEEVLPREMVLQGLDPNNAAVLDLALLLSELTESSGVLARARRGCAVVAGLQRAGNPIGGGAPGIAAGIVALDAPPPAPRARTTRKRAAATNRRARKTTRRRSPSS